MTISDDNKKALDKSRGILNVGNIKAFTGGDRIFIKKLYDMNGTLILKPIIINFTIQ